MNVAGLCIIFGALLSWLWLVWINAENVENKTWTVVARAAAVLYVTKVALDTLL
jgi:hypothetical protein